MGSAIQDNVDLQLAQRTLRIPNQCALDQFGEALLPCPRRAYPARDLHDLEASVHTAEEMIKEKTVGPRHRTCSRRLVGRRLLRVL